MLREKQAWECIKNGVQGSKMRWDFNDCNVFTVDELFGMGFLSGVGLHD